MKTTNSALRYILLIEKAENINAVVKMLINVPEVTSNSIVPFLMQIWCKLNREATAIKMMKSNTMKASPVF